MRLRTRAPAVAAIVAALACASPAGADADAGISGRVGDRAGGPLAGVCVGAEAIGDPAQPVEATTDELGAYAIGGLAPGDYRVVFSGCPGDGDPYPPRWWDGRATRAEADVIALGPDETRSGTDAILDEGGRIGGRVAAVGGGPLSNVCVSALTPGGELAGIVLSAVNGTYTIQGLASGSYRVRFEDCNPNPPEYASEYYDDQVTLEDGDPVDVGAPDTTAAIDAQLQRAGSISGTATLPGGGAAAQLCVGAHGPGAEDAFDLDRAVATAVTDADGDYRIGGLNPGTYRVVFGDCEVFDSLPPSPGYANEAFSDRPTLEQGDPVVVNPGANALADAEVALGGRIRGTVSDPSGPVAGVCVGAEDPATGALVAADLSDSDGDYRLAGVPVGSWAVRFFTAGCEGAPKGLVTEYYDDARDRASSTLVVVDAGAVVGAIDAELAPDPPPETTIVVGPAATGYRTDAAFAFASDEDRATFECRLDGAAFAPCWSPRPYSGLADGRHSFEVRAVDSIGQPDPSPAGRTWTVDGSWPTWTIAGTAAEGGAVSSDPTGAGPSAAEPLTVAVATPDPAEVAITIGPLPAPPPGLTLLGREAEITAPDATPDRPLRIVFRLDSGAIPAGTDPLGIEVLRDGAAAGDCAGDGSATPEPCVASRAVLADGDLEVAALASRASAWSLGLADPPPAGKCRVPALYGRTLEAAKAKIARTSCVLGRVHELRLPWIRHDVVLLQWPPPFARRPAGTRIDLVVAVPGADRGGHHGGGHAGRGHRER